MREDSWSFLREDSRSLPVVSCEKLRESILQESKNPSTNSINDFITVFLDSDPHPPQRRRINIPPLNKGGSEGVEY
jgi:hypothetical protein